MVRGRLEHDLVQRHECERGVVVVEPDAVLLGDFADQFVDVMLHSRSRQKPSRSICSKRSRCTTRSRCFAIRLKAPSRIASSNVSLLVMTSWMSRPNVSLLRFVI